MASDGCQTLPPGVPGGPPSSYGGGPAVETRGAVAAPATERYAAGVWYGPAPKGWTTPGDLAAPAAPPFNPDKEPRSVPLVGGTRLPLLGVAATDAASVSVALRRGSLLVSPGHEAAVGAALKASAAREQVFIAAVLPGAPSNAAGVKAAHAQLLEKLGVACVDLLLLDVSAAAQGSADPLPPPVAAAWTALCELQAGGATMRAVGVAHAGWRTLEALLAQGGVKPAVNLCELHPLLSQRKLCGFAQRKGIAMAALYPLAGGNSALMEHPTVLRLAQTYAKTPAQVLLRYNIQRGIAVFSKSGLGEEELSAAFSFRFEYADKVLLDELGDGKGQRFLPAHPGCSFAQDD